MLGRRHDGCYDDDGALAPHQLVLAELIVLLHGSCPPGLFVVPGPGVRMSVDTEMIPDLVVIRQDQLSAPRVTRSPLLAVEIQSPSTALFDLNTKKAVCESSASSRTGLWFRRSTSLS
jgi:Uma2 family endonuclease